MAGLPSTVLMLSESADRILIRRIPEVRADWSVGWVICSASASVNMAGFEIQDYAHEVVCLGIKDILMKQFWTVMSSQLNK